MKLEKNVMRFDICKYVFLTKRNKLLECFTTKSY